jgi:hypothetical protein
MGFEAVDVDEDERREAAAGRAPLVGVDRREEEVTVRGWLVVRVAPIEGSPAGVAGLAAGAAFGVSLSHEEKKSSAPASELVAEAATPPDKSRPSM